MATTNIGENRSYGQAVIDRFAGVKVPAPVKPHLAAFKKTHGEFEAASARADAAREKRDAALEVVGSTDDAFDESADALADTLVGAGLGERKNPFIAYSKHSPSALTKLAYAEEPKAMRLLVGEITRRKPPANVAKAASRCLKQASALEAALGQLTLPQAAYTRALAERDALLPAWNKALSRLKKHAAAAWDESEGVVRALFAPVDAVQAPKKRRARKPAAEAQPQAQPA